MKPTAYANISAQIPDISVFALLRKYHKPQ
jgi:hypothetical protein